MLYKIFQYRGCKSVIAPKIFQIINAECGDYKVFVDVFGGSAAMSIAARQMGKNVFYNDINYNLVDLFKLLAEYNSPREIDPFFNKFLTRAEYQFLKGEDSPRGEWATRIFSYNGFGTGYCPRAGSGRAWSEALKQDFLIETKRSTPKEILSRSRVSRTIELGVLKNITFTAMDFMKYLDFIKKTFDKEKTVIYCDPPYFGTCCGGYEKMDFSLEIFFDFLNKLKNYKIYVSDRNVDYSHCGLVRKFEIIKATGRWDSARKNGNKEVLWGRA